MLTDDEIMAQVLAAFQDEQVEHRQAIANLLLELEREPEHEQRHTLLDQLFREAHSLKGGARAAGQLQVEQLAHQIEDVFSAVRQGVLPLTTEVCDPVYAALDAIGSLMQAVADSQQPDGTIYQPLLAALSGIVQHGTTQSQAAAHSSDHSTGNGHALLNLPGARHNGHDAVTLEALASALHGDGSSNGSGHSPEAAGDTVSASVRVATANLDTLFNETGELIACTVRYQQHAHEAQQLLTSLSRWRRIWRQARPVHARLQASTPSIRPTVHYLEGYHDRPATTSTSVVDRETSVLLSALTQAQELIGELERQLTRHVREMIEDSSRLDAVAERLHSQVRRTRMLPLATLWSPLRLQVREVARASGKQVILDLDDGGAEADRQVLDGLREVLLHLLRNAVDHGIESAEQRLAGGKAAEGRITLCADVSGDRLTMTLRDDGAGLDLRVIQERALESGLISVADLPRYGSAELTELIFLPGFSTRKTVSALSGRGVGLDIVRSQLERMHGRVQVHSAPGAGCTFTMTVPLSLTSAHSLLLEADGALYAIPLDSVQRIIKVLPEQIQILEGRAALALSDRPTPLAHLADVLDGTAASPRQASLALVFGTGERQVACLVDAVLGEQELVVHRLPAPLHHVQGFSGATILADGRVAPMLDVVDLMRGVLGVHTTIAVAPASVTSQRRSRVLVVDDSITTRTLEKNILIAAGYDVYLAADGLEAWTLLHELSDDGGCDLLLSDVDMPRLTGFELTARVRAEPRLHHLPVVLVTSLDTPADRERGIAAGADAYLVKRGFDQHALLDTIAGLL